LLLLFEINEESGPLKLDNLLNMIYILNHGTKSANISQNFRKSSSNIYK
jgi:hypothetical protein